MRYLVRAELALTEVADRSRDERRASLAGVWVTPSGAWASDGYILVHVRHPRDVGELGAARAFLPRRVAQAALHRATSRVARRPVWPIAECGVKDGRVFLVQGKSVVHEFPMPTSTSPLNEERALSRAMHYTPTWGVVIPAAHIIRLGEFLKRASPEAREGSVTLYGGFGGSPHYIFFRVTDEHTKAEGMLIEGAMMTGGTPDLGQYEPPEPVDTGQWGRALVVTNGS